VSRSPARTPRARDPYGVGPVGSLIAPILAVIGLVVVAAITLSLLNGDVPFVGGPKASQGADNGGVIGPQLTPAPSNVVIVEPDVKFKGTFVYAKAGNIWTQTAAGPKQLTNSGKDSMPTWSPDGEYVYFIRTDPDVHGFWPERGTPTNYQMDVTNLFRVKADGSAQPERLATGKFRQGRYTFAYWIREPEVSPDGKSIAIISDAPNPDKNDVVLQFFDPATGRIRKSTVPENGFLGHQDPEWRPDGGAVLVVKNGRDGANGRPTIVEYDVKTKKTRNVTATGYTSPSYSPDGKYIAATRTSNLGTDVVILSAGNGRELARITTDGASFAPAWSPAGDAVAFLHLDGATTDLQLAKLTRNGSDLSVSEVTPLTEVSGLDPNSRPHWFIPAADLPPPTPAPTPPATPLGSTPASSTPASSASASPAP